MAAKKSGRQKHKTSCPEPAGTLLFIGGHKNKGEEDAERKVKPSTFKQLDVLKTFKECIGKKSRTVEVITTASGVPDEAFQDYHDDFKKLGFGSIGHIHHNNRKEVLEDNMEVRLKHEFTSTQKWGYRKR